MRDLTFHLTQHCAQLSQAVTRGVPSSSGAGTYQVYVRGTAESCTCPGFKFHGKCKHVAQVRAQTCQWDGEHDLAEQTVTQNVKMICPRCKGPTTWVREAA